jgi:hypothetical protein
MRVRAFAATALGAVVLHAQYPTTMAPQVRATHDMVAAANNFEVEAVTAS